MSGVVCDLYFYEAGTGITPASGPGIPDGEVQVAVLIGTPSTAKFRLNADFAYSSGASDIIVGDINATSTQVTFTGLVPGTYTVYARTSDSCLKTLQVVIPYEYAWGPKIRLQFDSVLGGHKVRFDIEELGYSGAIADAIGGGGSPLVLNYLGQGVENVFAPVISSELTVTLLSETDDQYSFMQVHDEIKYRGTLYLWDGTQYVKKWQGFKIPMIGVEPYVQEENYPISFVFTDGLKDLDKYEFTDDSGNAPLSRMSFLSAIVFCLNKTKLQLNIWDTVNIYANGMDTGTGTDSTLRDLYFDPTVYKNEDGTMEDCLTVLQSLLINLGARICQSEGVWMVDNPTLKTGSVTPTRKMTYNGGALSGADEAYRKMLRRKTAPSPKFVFKDRNAVKSFSKMFGSLEFIYDLGIEEQNNVLVNSKFEDEDIENGQLKGWQFEFLNPFHIVQGSIASVVKSEEKVDVLKFTYSLLAGIGDNEVAILSSELVNIYENASPYRLRFSFEVFFSPSIEANYAYGFIDYSIQITDGVDVWLLRPDIYPEEGANGIGLQSLSTDDLLDDEYVRTYVDDFNNWKTITLDLLIDPAKIGTMIDGKLQVKFRLSGSPLYDVTSLAALKAVSTFDAEDYPTRTYNNRRRLVEEVGGVDYIRYYKLEAGTEVESYPDIITPNDNLTMVWKLQASLVSPSETSGFLQQSWMKSIMIDNVQLQYLPDGADPVNEITTSVIVQPNVREKLSVVLRHGDLPSDLNLKNIARGWLSLEDGTPTSTWGYKLGDSIGAPYTLMELLQNIYQGQYSAVRQKLTGDAVCLEAFPWLGNTTYEVRTGKVHVNEASAIDFKQGTASVEIIEALTGAAVVDEGDTPDPDVDPPVDTHEHSEEFTEEFA